MAFAFEIRSVGKSDRHKKVYQYFSLPNGIWNRCSVAHNLALPVMKLWQDEKEEPNRLTRRINQLIEVQQHKDVVDEKL